MNALLVRSTSLQHTALVLDKLKIRFQTIRLDILTHTHAVESLKSLTGVREIIKFPYKGSFGGSRLYTGSLSKILINKKYDLVVVPVENISGIGYENVIAMAAGIRPLKIAVCNKAGEISVMSRLDVWWFLLKGYMFYPAAVIFSLYFIVNWLLRVAAYSITKKVKNRDK